MKRFLKSFKFAFNGLVFCFFNEKNFRFHIIFSFFIIIISIIFHLTQIEWLFIISAIFFVLISEIINTAIEKTLDLIDNNYNEKIKIIKDISASFVIMAAVYSVIVGVIIYLPYLLKLFKLC